MPKVKTQPRCAWELCNKKLIDLAFICKADGRPSFETPAAPAPQDKEN